MRLAGLNPGGVLCKLTHPDRTMANMPQTVAFAEKHGYPVLTIEDIVAWREKIAHQEQITARTTFALYGVF